MKRKVCFVLAFVASVYAPPGPHPEPGPHEHVHPEPGQPGPDPQLHDCHGPDHGPGSLLGPDCEHIYQALTDIGSHFDDHLCHVFHDVHCDDIVLLHDEQLCGSDGKTYSNHCQYVKARCYRILDHRMYENNPLWLAHHGACVIPTVPPLTTTSTSIRTQSTSGSVIMAAMSSGSGTTVKQTTSASSTTTKSDHTIFGGVFCQFKDTINCIVTLNLVCGSNGQFYPNICELLKVQCDNPTLRQIPDANHCSLSP